MPTEGVDRPAQMEVTPSMIEAGMEALQQYLPRYTGGDLSVGAAMLSAVFASMEAKAPRS